MIDAAALVAKLKATLLEIERIVVGIEGYDRQRRAAAEQSKKLREGISR